MAILHNLFASDPTYFLYQLSRTLPVFIALIFGIPLILLLSQICYNLFFHPLRALPGPLLGRASPLWLWYHTFFGTEGSTLHRLHKKHGHYIRISPNRVSVSDSDVLAAMYTTRGGFRKAPNYRNFDIDGHATLFSADEPEYRNVRAKPVKSLFSTASINSHKKELSECVDHFVAHMKAAAATGKPVNMLNLGRSFTLDATCAHVFSLDFKSLSESSVASNLSAGKFVDSFIAVGQFFNLSHGMFMWVDWLIGLFADAQTEASFAAVQRYIDELVKKSDEKSDEKTDNYASRLLELGLEESEVKAQCKDVVFAAADVTGHNCAMLCRYLAQHPDVYEILRKEVAENRAKGDAKEELRALPWLSAVVEETLRLSFAAAVMFPRVVPDSGLMTSYTLSEQSSNPDAKPLFLPPGTIVGASPYELHHAPEVFPDPYTWQPSRWVTADKGQKDLMHKHSIAFGQGLRTCIAKNLAMVELLMAAEGLVAEDCLRGAKLPEGEERLETFEWFNSKVKSGQINLVWDN